MIYGAKALPTTALPLSQINADFPACKMWFRMLEVAKNDTDVLADKIGLVTDMTVDDANAIGDGDAVANAFQTSGVVSNEVFARNSDATIFVLGSNHLLIEVDVELRNTGDSGGVLIEVGNPFSNQKGWHFNTAIAAGEVRAQILVRNAANNNSVSSTLGLGPDLVGARRHLLLACDTSVDPWVMKYFVDGVQQGTTWTLSNTVGGNADVTTGTISIGQRKSSSLVADADFYNVRVWTPAAMPTNIANIAVQMASNPDEFPALMAGLA